jgi:hypothetical protein
VRREALKPDKDKLTNWLKRVENAFDDHPELSTDEGMEMLENIVRAFDKFMRSSFDWTI